MIFLEVVGTLVGLAMMLNSPYGRKILFTIVMIIAVIVVLLLLGNPNHA